MENLPCGRPFTDVYQDHPQDSGEAGSSEGYQTKLRAYARDQGLNQSQSRNRILDVILQVKEHFSAQDLVSRVQRKHPKIGAATVYRNLPVYVQAGILRACLSDVNGQTIFELKRGGHHDHIICLDCNRILEFHDEEIETQQHSLLQRLKFREKRHRHILYAHCNYFKEGEDAQTEGKNK